MLARERAFFFLLAMPDRVAETSKGERVARAVALAGLMLIPVLTVFVHVLLIARD